MAAIEKDEMPHLNRQERDYMKAMQERIDWLNAKMKEQKMQSGTSSNYLLRETQALTWAYWLIRSNGRLEEMREWKKEHRQKRNAKQT